jgi:hypothetical protein
MFIIIIIMNDNNLRKIICFNIIKQKKCNYGNKCMYAHSLEEQKVDQYRIMAYKILKSKSNLSNLNLLEDEKLYETLIQLTKVCSMCVKGFCSGGYNCRNGAINHSYKICYIDLVSGNCKNINCDSIHLTLRNLVPYNTQKNNFNNLSVITVIGDPKNTTKFKNKLTNDDIFYKCNNNVKKELDNIKGILLTDEFMLKHFGKNNNNNVYSDSDTTEDLDKMIKYFNDNDSDSDESIFLV